jgi:membrane associated rhomboid family serine protease
MRTATQDIYGNPNELTYGVQMLLIANIVVFVIQHILHVPIPETLALWPDWWRHGAVWQLITYQFLHAGIWHLFSNLLALYFLGPDVERGLGTNRFFALYFLSGILGGLGWALLSPPDSNPCVGASGAIFGVLGAYAALYPNRELVLIFFPFMPLKAWTFVLLLGAYEFTQTLAYGSGSHVANAAHLGGGIAGYIYALTLARPNLLATWKRRIRPPEQPPVRHAEIDRILDKAAQHGMHSLTKSERETLKRAGRQ